MKRRSFLGTLVVSVLGLFGIGAACVASPETPQDLRAVWRRQGVNLWVRVRMHELHKGDIFRVEEVGGTWQAGSEPWLKDGTWGIEARGPHAHHVDGFR